MRFNKPSEKVSVDFSFGQIFGWNKSSFIKDFNLSSFSAHSTKVSN